MDRKKLKHTIDINASKQKVWDVLLDDETYRQWTSVFSPGSHAEGGWDEGSKVHFKDGEGRGLVSMVRVHKPAETITFEHIGILDKNTEDLESEEVKKWSGSLESYNVQEKDGRTTLNIEMDITPEYEEYMNTTWGKALELVKQLSEK
jgi:uncharacterized protein YndB with AHSA1/START domain